MKLNGIQAVFFDYGGTLDADGIPWKQQHQRIYESLGIRVPQERFDRAFYDADDSLTEEGPDNLSYRETLRTQAGRVLDGLRIRDDELRERIVEEFFQKTSARIHENKKILQHLAERYRLGIISNFYGNLETICNELGLSTMVEVIVDSRRIGHLKPDAEMFHYALRALKVPAENALMVGDSLPRDMAGARGVGMPHVLLVPKDKKEPIQLCCPGDKIIHCLRDLLEIL